MGSWSLRGPVFTPGSAGHDEARRLYDAIIDKRPALIGRCRDVADVRAVVDFARREGFELAVRSGGHNGAGLGGVDDGLAMRPPRQAKGGPIASSRARAISA